MITVEIPRRISVQEIRKKYPNPVRSEGSTRNGENYCVGGALCKFIQYRWGGVDWDFPPAFVIVQALRIANPSLANDMALMRAMRITRKNDRGDFEAAWIALDKALRWGKGKNDATDAISIYRP